MEHQSSFLKDNKKKESSSKPDSWEIFIDGAARGNPGPAGAGIFIKKNNKTVLEKGIFLGKKTNNQAEYLALALSVFLLQEKFSKKIKKSASIIITSDSELLVKQMKGIYKVKNPILYKIKALTILLQKEIKLKFKHVKREKNKIADNLANIGVDEKGKMPTKFKNMLEKEKVFS